ncbi:MAG: hypothetical protein M3I41_06780 [Actinomyces graevenitzii]|uniref:CobQ/CobB/MinD/ParA nucleotide binding domain-containing protein n=1 Tax=Actinomyces graevenitzii TaxID=55565 RepID=A0A9E7AQL7_9ACTO|nr:MAG: hypothetical protein M3I41_06780 [Actinomyces graevenitzii]
MVAEISRVLVAGTVSPQPTAAASLGDELFGLSPTAVDDGALGLPSVRSAAFNPLDVPMAATTDGASSPLFDAVVQSQASASSPPPAPPEQLPPPPFDSAVGQVPLIAPTEAPASSGQLDPALVLPLPPAPSFEPPAPSADLPEAPAELPVASSEQSPADITAAQPTTRMGRRRARHASHAASPVTPSQGNTSSYFSTASQEQSGEAKARVEPDDPLQQLNDSNVDTVKSAVSAGQTSIDSPPLPEGALAARVLPQPVQPVTRRSVRRSQTARPAAPSDPVAAAQAAGAGIEVSPFAPPQQRGVASSDLAGSGFSASTGMSAASAGPLASAASFASAASAAPYGSAASAAPYGSAASAAPYASAASAAIPTAASGAGGPWSAMSAAGTAWSATSAPFAASAAAPGGPMPAQTQVLAPGQINGYQNPAGSNGAQPPRRKGLRALLARKNGASTPSAGGPVIAGAPGAMPGTAPGGVPGVGIPGAGAPGAMPGVGASGAGAPGLPGMPRSAMAAPAAAGVPGVVPGVMAPGMPGAGPVAGAVPGAAGIPGAVGVPGAGGPGMPGGQGAPGAAMPTAMPGSQGAPSAYAPNGQPRAVNGPASPGAALTPNGGLPTRRSTRAAFSAASAAGSGAAGAGPAGAGPARAGGAGVTGALAAASSQNNAAPLNAAATTHSAQPEVKLGWPVTAGTPSSPATSAFAPTSHREEIDAAGKPKIGKIIAVWGTHGAPGRSTLALALAAYLNEQGSTILVDCDINAPAQVQLLGLPEDSSGLASAARLATHGELDSTRLVQTLLSAKADLQVLTGLGRSGRWRELPVASMNKVWEVCRHTAEYTVVDLSGGLEEERVEDFAMEPDHDAVAAALLEQADLTLIVGAADPVGIRRLIQLLNSNRQAVGGRSQVVVNRVRSSTAGADPNTAIGSVLARYTSASDIVYVPADYRLFDKALMQAQPVAVVESRSAAAKSIAKLAKLVMTQLA